MGSRITEWIRTVAVYFEKRRFMLFTTLLFLIALLLFPVFTKLQLEEDLQAFIPRDDPNVARQLELLNNVSLSRHLLIHVSSQSGDQDALLEAGRRLEEALVKPPFITRILGGMQDEQAAVLFQSLNDRLSLLLDADDLKRLEDKLTPEGIKAQLQENLRVLQSPDGFLLKSLILEDPVSCRDLLLEKMKDLKFIPETSLEGGRFVSKDSTFLLLLAETDIAPTDSMGARNLLNHIEEVSQKVLPDGIEARIQCAHAYSAANAQQIQKDMRIVLLVSIIGIILIVLAFLRTWKSLILLIAPAVSLLTGISVTCVIFSHVSAITIGFGAVLLGISVDYAIHFFFSLKSSSSKAVADSLEKLTIPLLISALTTALALMVLLTSSIGAHRQLAVFAIAGIVSALLFTLVVLPHFGSINFPVKPPEFLEFKPSQRNSRIISGLWGVLIIATLFCLPSIKFSGSMRNMYVVPDELKSLEEEITATWGNVRGRAFVVSEGKSLQETLEINDALRRSLKMESYEGHLFSIASVLPSLKTQQENHKAWENFWTNNRITQVSRLLREQSWPEQSIEAFVNKIQSPVKPIQLETFSGTGLDELLGDMILSLDDSVIALSLIEDTPENIRIFLKLAIPGTEWITERGITERLSVHAGSEFRRIVGIAFLSILVTVFLCYRNFRQMILVVAPVSTGILVLFSCMTLAGQPLNIFHIVSALLIIGLGMDYGVLMTHWLMHQNEKSILLSILVSGLTTVAGFGALALAVHPVLKTMGLSVSLGMVVVIVTAIGLLPAIKKTLYRQ